MVRKSVAIQESKRCRVNAYIAVKKFRHDIGKLKLLHDVRRCFH